MKSIKYLVVLACMTLGLDNVAMAQVYNCEVMFFTSVKSNTSDYHVIDVVKIIDGNKLYIWGRSTKNLLRITTITFPLSPDIVMNWIHGDW